MTLRALILARYFGIAIQKKQVHQFYKSDVPASCKQGFPSNICGPIIDLKNAFLKVSFGINQSQNFYYKCVDTLKRSQAVEMASLHPFNIFTYSDMCNGITHIMVQLQRLEKINDDDKVCDVVYSYLLELYRRDSELYLKKFCSNQPFKGQNDFMKVCMAGFKDTHSLFWLSNKFQKLCSLSQQNVMKRCGSNKACDFCAVIDASTSDEIASEWKNMTSIIYTKQIKIEQEATAEQNTPKPKSLAEMEVMNQKYKLINRAKLIKSRQVAEDAVKTVIQDTKTKDKETEDRRLKELRKKEAREAAQRAMNTNK